MVMIISHIVANILFWLFIILVVSGIRQCIKTVKYSKFIITTSVIGIIVYIFYLVMLITCFDKDGFDAQSFTLVMLSWAFENSSYCIMNKNSRQ